MISFIIISICWIITIILVYLLVKKLKQQNYDRMMLDHKNISNLEEERNSFEKRVKELENGIKDQFGISVRNEVTKVECIFTKLEMVIIMAGVYQLIEHSGNIDDKEAYIKLYKKAQEYTEKMEEEQTDG